MKFKGHASPRTRRRVNAVWLVIAGLLLGCAAYMLSPVGNTERITRLWASASVAADGSARVTEVIDWDFGNPGQPKHGIYRDVPGLSLEAEVTATVDGRPVPAEMEWLSGHETRIRVGDADSTVTPGVHRYRLTYPLDDLAPGHRLAWNAVGTGWDVRIDDVRVQVVAPFRLTGIRCVQGASGSRDGCPIAQSEPGHLTAEFATLAAHRGVTLSGTATATRVEAAALDPSPVAGPHASDRPHRWTVAAWVTGAALAAMALTALLLRRLGRAPLSEGPLGERRGPKTTKQTGPQVSPRPVRLVDLTRREKDLRPARTPPEDLSADRAGVLYAGRVLPRAPDRPPDGGRRARLALHLPDRSARALPQPRAERGLGSFRRPGIEQGAQVRRPRQGGHPGRLQPRVRHRVAAPR